MLRFLLFTLSVFLLSGSLFATGTPQKQTIVIIRHAEKPERGLGQLNCTGLNRALKLPNYFKSHFPAPDKILAPDPAIKALEKHGDGRYYNYVRPLVTIEPTAISLTMPVNTEIGYNQPERLFRSLIKECNRNSVIYVAWEHTNILEATRLLLKHFKVSTKIPDWDNSNYNMVFVFNIDWSKTLRHLISR